MTFSQGIPSIGIVNSVIYKLSLDFSALRLDIKILKIQSRIIFCRTIGKYFSSIKISKFLPAVIESLNL